MISGRTFNPHSWVEGEPGEHMVAMQSTDQGQSWSDFTAIEPYSNVTTNQVSAYVTNSPIHFDDSSMTHDVNKIPPSTSFLANSRTLTTLSPHFRRGVGAPHQCPLESVASYLCHCMLTRSCTFR